MPKRKVSAKPSVKSDKSEPSKKRKIVKVKDDIEEKPKKTPKGKAATSAKKSSKKAESKGATSKATSSSAGSSLSLEDGLKCPNWKKLLAKEFEMDYWKKLISELSKEYDAKKEIFPPQDLIFNAFNETPLEKVKVVILGQDPYHDNGQAHGLSFSVSPGVAVPPSLKNMYKELSTDIKGFKTPNHGCLLKWAKEGVLLLNATLTVRAHEPNSHAKFGWQTFTDHVLKLISDNTDGVVFILWGGFAQKKEKLLDSSKHHIIKAAHPSPLSCTKFFGSKCFSQTQDALKKFKKAPIDWNLD